MRSFRLTSALAAAATVLAVAPTGASAAPGHNGVKRATPVGHCRLTELAEPHIVISGESAQVFGQLLCPGSINTSGQTVTIYGRSAGSAFAVLGTATTGAGGFYSIIAPSLTRNSSFYAATLGGRSATRTVKVSPQVLLNGPKEGTQIFTGRRGAVIFTGTVNPADAGAEVVLQRAGPTGTEEWGIIQRGIVAAGGAYSFTHVFGRAGDANLRVVVRAHHGFSVRGISNTLSYQISQRENPALTLNTSGRPDLLRPAGHALGRGRRCADAGGDAAGTQRQRRLHAGCHEHDQRRQVLVHADAAAEHRLPRDGRRGQLGAGVRGRQIRAHRVRLGDDGARRASR